MAEVFKILGQLAPSAATLTDLYTVPTAKSTTVSTITVCNRSATATIFRISVAVAGATDAVTQYLYYDQAIDGNSTYAITIGITLAATDKIRVYSTLATLTFCAFGVEVS
jgi:hypothetical protein